MDRIQNLADELAYTLMPIGEWPIPEVISVGPAADGQRKPHLLVLVSAPPTSSHLREFKGVEVVWKVAGKVEAL
jgi:hypothetical protein